jgi:hypothetical protein
MLATFLGLGTNLWVEVSGECIEYIPGAQLANIIATTISRIIFFILKVYWVMCLTPTT